MKTRVGTVVLCVVSAFLGSGFTVPLLAQLTYEDLVAGYRANQASFEDASFQMKWRSHSFATDYEDQFRKSFATLGKVLRENPKGWPVGGRELHSIRLLQASYDLNMLKPRDFDTGTWQLFHGSTGSRLRRAFDSRAVWSDDGFPEFLADSDADLRVLTVLPNEPFFSNALTFNRPPQGLTRRFVIAQPNNAMSEYPDACCAPICINFQGHPTVVKAPYDELYWAKEDSEARAAAQIEIRLEGDIAFVEIEDAPLALFPNSVQQYGWKIYAEIEVNKGCLPRLVKRSRIFRFGERINRGLADTTWGEVLEFENAELAGVGFYPRKIEARNYRCFPTEENIARILESDNPNFIHEFDQVQQPLDEIVESDRRVTEVEAISLWEPKQNNHRLSFDVPTNADSVFDFKNNVQGRQRASDSPRIK